MTIRSIIILLTVPLFLAMAAVNGALLYFQEKSDLSRAFGNQALAAAVVSAEFIAQMDYPERELTQPLRQQALDAASSQIPGLQGVYFVHPNGSVFPLMTNSAEWSPQAYAPVSGSRILETIEDSDEARFVAALAPVASGGFVAARIDAEPMFARIDTIKRAILLIVLGVSVFSALLSWFVARRIGRELQINRQSLAAISEGGAASQDDVWRIQETRDLAEAVRLMAASQKAAETRSHRVVARNDQKRVLEGAVERSRTALLEPLVQRAGGAEVAMRICGDANPGAFFALAETDAETDAGAVAVIGCCGQENPADALAQALAARRFFEAMLGEMNQQECLSLAREAYAIKEIEMISWRADELPQGDARLLCITDAQAEAGARRYVGANLDASADEWLEGIEVLLAPTGIFAAISATASANRIKSA